ncbi:MULTISPECIES: hypothetical protein [Burkholderia]|nr:MULTISPECIES: hypothetical protein [Burkholderia]MDN7570580.1 hypothetical protein [Burkholderia contaminans]
MLLNKWKDGSAGYGKAIAAAFANALLYAGISGIATLIVINAT